MVRFLSAGFRVVTLLLLSGYAMAVAAAPYVYT
jgi:hypothetical protein